MEKYAKDYKKEFNEKFNPHPPENAKPSLKPKCQHEYRFAFKENPYFNHVRQLWEEEDLMVFYCVKCLDIQKRTV